MKNPSRARATRFILAASSLALVLACGGSAVTEGGGGSGGQGASSASSSSTSSSSGNGGGQSCDDFIPPPDSLGQPVDVRIENHTSADLYLGDPNLGCDPYHAFTLYQGSGDPPGPVPLEGVLGLCEYTCGELQQTSCMCPAGCAAPAAVRIVPGGAYVDSWGGHIYQPTNMPAACYQDASCAGGTCLMPKPAPHLVRVDALAYDSVNCGGMGCTCTPDSDGSCQITDGPPQVGGGTHTGTAMWSQGETSVTIAIGP